MKRSRLLAVVLWVVYATALSAAEKRHAQQGIREFISHVKEEIERDEDNLPDLIEEAAQWATAMNDVAAQAVLHSLVAEMYDNYYSRNRRIIDRHIGTADSLLSDMRTWNADRFAGEIEDHLRLSLMPPELLQQIPVSTFGKLMTPAGADDKLRPTLYDFLAGRAVDLRPSAALYADWLAFRHASVNSAATLRLELDFLYYRYTLSSCHDSVRTSYEAALADFADRYEDCDCSNEIRIARIEYLEGIPERLYSPDSVHRLQYLLCKEGIARHPNYHRTILLHDKLAQLEEPVLSSSVPRTVYPSDSIDITISWRNISSLRITLRQENHDINQTDIILPNVPPYSLRDTVIRLPVPSVGAYEYIIASPQHKLRSVHPLAVTRLAAVGRRLVSGETEILAVDLRSGQPLDASIQLLGGRRDALQPLDTLRTDTFGLACIPADISRPMAFRPFLPNDTASPPAALYVYNDGLPDTSPPPDLTIFTDRSLYRPGQSLAFKGLAYIPDELALPDCTFTLSCLDANNRIFASQTFTTNTFGAFTGHFDIPADVTLGTVRFTSSLGGGITASAIRIEEYKRPAFAIEWLPVSDSLPFGEDVVLRALTTDFTGIPLRRGNVEWRIRRYPSFFYKHISDKKEDVATGRTTLLHDGTFSVTFRPMPPNDLPSFRRITYEIIATITDSRGETQSSRYTFFVGDPSPDIPYPTPSDSLFVPLHTERLLIGDTARFLFLSTDTLSVLYELFDGNGSLLSRQRLTLHNEACPFAFPFLSSFGKGVTVSFSYIRNGQLHTARLPIFRKLPDRSLSFTARLSDNPPAVTFSLPSAEPAEILLSVYDKSLDRILPNRWTFSPDRPFHPLCPTFHPTDVFWPTYQHASVPLPPPTDPSLSFRRIDWQNALPIPISPLLLRSASAKNINEAIPAQSYEDISLRSNFAETALFAPLLTPDSAGFLTVTIPLPELNTTWMLQAFVHTPSLRHGFLTKELTAARPLMILPSFPRFFRQGDRTTLTARILSRTNALLDGIATLAVDSYSTQTVPISALGEQTVDWTIDIPATDSLHLRFTAKTGEGSDGELRLIPVLPAETVTDTCRPDTSADPYRRIFNAFRAMTKPAYEDVLSRFAAHFARTVLAHYEDTTSVFFESYDSILSPYRTSDGAFSWFPGLSADPRITVALLDALSQYHRITAFAPAPAEQTLYNDALRYLDRHLTEQYNSLTPDYRRRHIPTIEQTALLHLRLFTYADIPIDPDFQHVYRYFTARTFDEALHLPLLSQVHAALLAQHLGKRRLVVGLLRRFRFTATHSPTQGMFWANARGDDFFFTTPLAIHSLLTDLFIRVSPSSDESRQLLQWLLAQKRVQDWPPHPATLCALSTLLAHLHDLPPDYASFDLTPIPSDTLNVDFLSIEKQFHLPDTFLRVGDQLLVRLVIRTDRDMSYVLLEDPRPACLDPSVDRSSFLPPFRGYHSPRDASETFFIPHLTRGTHLIEYTAPLSHAGRYATPSPILRSLYAPEVVAPLPPHTPHLSIYR
ncbi:MAG: hypothetical protein LBU03_01695 [Tannerellaceae bacterium]|jgi:hypothetical protein|nr:hypothetical protein [Tannerellaceae bacterium]